MVYGSQDQTVKDSLGGKGRYEHSTLAIELLAGWEVQTSDYNSNKAGPHGTVQMLNVRLKMFWALYSLITITKYFFSESHMLSLAIFLLRKTTLFQMFLSWQIATSPDIENGCILPVHACVRRVRLEIAVPTRKTFWSHDNAKVLQGFKATIPLRHLCPGPSDIIIIFSLNLYFNCLGQALFWGEPSMATGCLSSNACYQLR